MKKKIVFSISLILLLIIGVCLCIVFYEDKDEYKPVIINGEKIYDGTELEEEYIESLKQDNENSQQNIENKTETTQDNNLISNPNEEKQLVGQYFGFGDDANHFSIYSNGIEHQIIINNDEFMSKLDELEFEQMITITYKIESGNKVLVNIKE